MSEFSGLPAGELAAGLVGAPHALLRYSNLSIARKARQMTTKYLTGAYPAGYTVAKDVTYLDIKSTASIGGAGISCLYTQYAVQIVNDGTINSTSGNGMTYFPHGGNIVNGETNHAALVEGAEN